MELEQKLDFKVSYDLMTALETELKCSICLDLYNDPHSTNCGHYFCKECLVNYQKEMKYKCACPLCKKPLNRRELMEAPKIRTITELFKKMFVESSRIPSSTTSSQQGIKKRKLNDFLLTPQDTMRQPAFNSSRNNSRGFHTISEGIDDKSCDTEFGMNKLEIEPIKKAERQWKSLTGKGDYITEMLGKLDDLSADEVEVNKTPTRYSLGDLAPLQNLQNQTTVTKSKPKNNSNTMIEEEKERGGKESIPKNICLVTTSLPPNLQDEVQKFCKKFKVKQYKDYNENITHMVIYPSVDTQEVIQAKRTVKYVLGVIKGIWIVSFKWIIDSIINDGIQSEVDYEATEDCYGSGAPQYSRLNGGMRFLFKGYNFHIADGDKMVKPALPKSDMIHIIEKAGGNIVKSMTKNGQKSLNIVIQGAESGDTSVDPDHYNYNKKSNLVSHKWILDSISNHTILELKGYYVI